jgi:hypothetical protein
VAEAEFGRVVFGEIEVAGLPLPGVFCMNVKRKGLQEKHVVSH